MHVHCLGGAKCPKLEKKKSVFMAMVINCAKKDGGKSRKKA